MYRLLFILYFSTFIYSATLAEEIPTGLLTTAKPSVEGVPGLTCLNVVTLTNPTDLPWPLRIRVTIPPKLHLLNHVPASVIVPAHGTLSIPIKLLVDRQWTDEEAFVRVEAFTGNSPEPVVSTQFTVQQRRSVNTSITFAFVDDHPYVTTEQDTLMLRLRITNEHYRPHSLRLSLRSLPDGFVLAPLSEALTVGGRRDTLIHLPVLVKPSLKWSQTYDLLLDVFDHVERTLLGVATCRPVLLSAVKSQVKVAENGGAPNGVLLGLSRLGQFGYFSELRTWGQQGYKNGQLSFQLNALSFSGEGGQQLDFRDTYLQFQTPNMLLRAGMIYDNHELPLMGLGVKAAVNKGNLRLEGWAVAGRNSVLHDRGYSYYSQIYSLRLTGALPVGQAGTYSVSASRYYLGTYDRVGWLSFGTANWQPSLKSKIRMLAATSVEYGRQASDRRQTTGWALGGNYHRSGERLTLNLNTYFSNPQYGGYQRGLSHLDASVYYRIGKQTTLSQQISLLTYNQQFLGGADGLLQRYFGNRLASMALMHRVGRVSLSLQPYYWLQAQTLGNNIRQTTDTYRLLTSLHYEPTEKAHVDMAFDFGRYRGLAPVTDQYEINTYRVLSTLTYRNLSLFGTYQQGPYLINDRLPGSGSLKDTRQFMLSPGWVFNLLNGQLQGGLGAGLIYTSQNQAWNGTIRHSASMNVTENLQFRWNVNLFSTAISVTDLRPAPVQNALVSLEVMRQFQDLRVGHKRSIRLRFYEDENANHQRDANEPWLEGIVVNIRGRDGQDTPLLTDHKGTITYKVQTPGLYLVKTVCRLSTGEPILFSDSLRLERSIDRDMPIRKTWPVKGNLVHKRGRFDDGPAGLDGYRVEARSSNGELLRTYADEVGRFTLFLPVGDYQVSVFNSRVYPPKPVMTTSYRVATGSEPGAMQLEFESGGRPVNIKRFSSR